MSENNRRRRAPAKTKSDRPADPDLVAPSSAQTAALVVPDHAKLTEVVRRNLERIPGSSRNAREVNAVLAWAAKNTNLVTPAARVGTIPEGCSVAFVVIWCDPELKKNGGDCFPVSGERMPAKHILDQIAQAAGIKWDPQLGGRVDDASHPHYCHYKAVGHVTHFDGTEAVLVREKQMDLRDGSPFIRKLEKDAAKKDRNPEDQIIELRGFILEHAESKAKNRVIRSLGMKTSYTKQELEAKPFVVAKLMFTGETDDPERRRHFANMRAEKMLGGTRALFGVPSAQQVEGQRSKAPPPPVAASAVDADDFPGEFEHHNNVIDAPRPTPPAREKPPAPAKGSDGGDDDGGGGDRSGVVIPGGDKKGTPIEDESVTLDDLIYWAGRIEGDIE
ncbi:MAG: hypothetical protein MJA83_12010, partial [Gammaproteobacteria bacterium]|nr:hypothetical protein [Gammaproteobacteria bacterium]